ncbi:MAG: alpha/beta hydrolase [Roseivirga sp.]
MNRNSTFYSPLLLLFLTLFFGWGCNNSPNSSKDSTPQKPVIVLMHGLNSSPVVFADMKQALEQAFPGAQVLPLEEKETPTQSISAQARRAYAQLQQAKVGKEQPMLLVGHSQGGLRAYEMGTQYEGELNVKGVVTIGTPWLGATAMKNNELVQALEGVDVSNKPLFAAIIPLLLKEAKALENSKSGVADMHPDGGFIAKIRRALLNNDCPTLAIAGDQGDTLEKVLNHLPADQKSVHIQGQDYTLPQILGGIFSGKSSTDMATAPDNYEPHDLLLTVESQRAEGIDAKKFERFTVQGALHILVPPVIPGTRELTNAFEPKHPEVIREVVEFTGKQLGLKPASTP